MTISMIEHRNVWYDRYDKAGRKVNTRAAH